MAEAPPPLVFDTSFSPETGRSVPVAPGLTRVTAPNAGPFTFTGTNSFLIGDARLVILDPGPADAAHAAALRAAIAGRRVEAILLTHTHLDHSESAKAFAREFDVPIWSGGRHRLSRPRRQFELNPIGRDCDWSLVPDRVLGDGEGFMAGDVALSAIATPGHCANHLAFALEDGDLLLTGDHVMGWNSTLVAVPDGSMRDYLNSLRKVIAAPYQRYVPAHGGPIPDGPRYAAALLAHRQLRNDQVRSAIAAGAATVAELIARIYPQLTGRLRFAAGLTLTAHIEYLEGEGEIAVRRFPWGMRLGSV